MPAGTTVEWAAGYGSKGSGVLVIEGAVGNGGCVGSGALVGSGGIVGGSCGVGERYAVGNTCVGATNDGNISVPGKVTSGVMLMTKPCGVALGDGAAVEGGIVGMTVPCPAGVGVTLGEAVPHSTNPTQ